MRMIAEWEESSMEKKYIGLDIGGTKCCVLLAEVNHGIVITDKIRFATCVDKGFD